MGVHQTWGKISVQPLTSSMNLGKLFNFFGTQFQHLLIEPNDTHFEGLLYSKSDPICIKSFDPRKGATPSHQRC